MKNKLVLIIVILACFIPTAIAYASYTGTRNAPVDEKNAVQISIDDINGKNFTFTKKEDGDEADRVIQFFLKMKKNATQIVALPDSLLGEQFFKITLSNGVRSEVSEFYFSPDPATCYFRRNDGTTYKIAEADAEVFITTEYAESLYDTSIMPVLTFSNTYTLSPDGAIWQYKNYTGQYVDADTSDIVVNTVEDYDIEGGIDLSFSIEPDICNILITDIDGTVLYDDSYAQFHTFGISETKRLKVSVTAKWYEDPARSFCGEVNYVFTSRVTAPAVFYLGLTKLEAGKFTAITALNVTKPEKITFSSTIDDDYKPVFYSEGEATAVALLPIPVDTPSGLYTLTFTYGGTTQETILTVKNEGEKISSYTVPESVISVYRSAAALEEFATESAKIMSSADSTRYFSGYFLGGIAGDNILLRGFGRDVYLNDSATVTYRNNGVDYRSAAGVNVVACNAGRVVYAGNLNYTGNIVVIEHGYGLKTWYYNLGSISVSVDDTVARGDAIGTTGSTGFTGEVGAHIAMSVGDRFVSPYDTWQDSVEVGKVVIAKIDE